MKKKYFYKGILFTLSLFLSTFLFSQDHNHNHPHDEFYKFGELTAGQVNFTDFDRPHAIAKRNIKFVFGLAENSIINISKTEMIDRYDRGWYLNIEFEADGKIGLYRREIREINNEFFISIVGNAQTCICTDCEALEFSRFTNDCDCTKPVSGTTPEVTYRVFSAAN